MTAQRKSFWERASSNVTRSSASKHDASAVDAATLSMCPRHMHIMLPKMLYSALILCLKSEASRLRSLRFSSNLKHLHCTAQHKDTAHFSALLPMHLCSNPSPFQPLQVELNLEDSGKQGCNCAYLALGILDALPSGFPTALVIIC